MTTQTTLERKTGSDKSRARYAAKGFVADLEKVDDEIANLTNEALIRIRDIIGADNLIAIRQIIASTEAEIEQHVKVAEGKAELARKHVFSTGETLEGVHVSVVPSKDRVSFDKARLEAEQPDIYEQYKKVAKVRPAVRGLKYTKLSLPQL